MADDTLLHVLGSLGSGAAAWLTTALTTAKKQGKRLSAVEAGLKNLREQAGRALDLDTNLDERIRRVAKSVLESELDERVRRAARASRPDAGMAPILRGHAAERDLEERVRRLVKAEIERELKDIQDEVEKLRAVAEHAATEDELADFISQEAGRWQEVHRSLGQIEGMLGTVRDGLGMRGRKPNG